MIKDHKTSMYYTGVGSREISSEEASIIVAVSTYLADLGFILRSGHAKGSDECFEYGALLSTKSNANYNRDIYVPWNSFDGAKVESTLINVGDWDNYKLDWVESLARVVHGGWHNLSSGAKTLHSRNIPQVLGNDLKSPSRFLLFCSDITSGGNVKVGTATAVKLAKAYSVPCFNVRNKTKRELFDFLKPLIENK